MAVDRAMLRYAGHEYTLTIEQARAWEDAVIDIVTEGSGVGVVHTATKHQPVSLLVSPSIPWSIVWPSEEAEGSKGRRGAFVLG